MLFDLDFPFTFVCLVDKGAKFRHFKCQEGKDIPAATVDKPPRHADTSLKLGSVETDWGFHHLSPLCEGWGTVDSPIPEECVYVYVVVYLHKKVWF